MPKKTYTSAEKLEVVKELIKGDKPQNLICAKHGISKSAAMKWKKQFEENAHLVFELEAPKKQKEEDKPEYLKGIIGNLTVENDILKKALSVWG
jgi:transposase-like protein